jgi:Cytochrome c554 and c-prime
LDGFRRAGDNELLCQVKSILQRKENHDEMSFWKKLAPKTGRLQKCHFGRIFFVSSNHFELQKRFLRNDMAQLGPQRNSNTKAQRAQSFIDFSLRTLCLGGFKIFAVVILMALPSSIIAQYKTLGPGSCGLGQNNCHTSENDWWKDDAHHATVDAFYDDPTAYEKIARLAGVDTGSMLKGNQSCMPCHGTVISGKETREAEDGVSCESCHGPGSAYKDPHSEGDPKLGVNRPGRIKAMQLGMVELKNLDNRATTCVRCHYITDQKLLAAGHPNGANFNYISGLKKVAKHWKRPPGGDDLVKAPFEKAMNAKGPVAQMVSVAPAVAAAPAPPAKTEAATAPPAANVATPAPTQPAKPVVETSPLVRQKEATTPPPVITPRQTAAPPPPMPTAVSTPMENMAPPAPLDLPPFPSVSDTASVQEILLILKKRLELLYQRTGGNQ